MANKTVTVKASAGDYTTLNAALSGESADLTSGSYYGGGPGILYIDCYNLGTSTEDTTAADTGSGYTTDASYYIHIRGVASERTTDNARIWSTARYRIIVQDGGRPLVFPFHRVRRAEPVPVGLDELVPDGDNP